MFVHLHLHSPYSFLDGGSNLETLVMLAASYGMPALALTDHNNTAAAVKFSALCTAYSIAPILGAEITLEDDTHLTFLAKNRAGYANLCRLITQAYTSGGRLTPRLPWTALGIARMGSGTPGPVDGPCLPIDDLFVLSGCHRSRLSTQVRAHRYMDACITARAICERFGQSNFYIELQDDFTPASNRTARELARLADEIGVGVVATNNVHFATPDDFLTHHLLSCVATGTTQEAVHPDKPLNSERYLKPAGEMENLFSWRPDAIANTLHIAKQCENALPRPEDVTPRYPVPDGKGCAAVYLRHLVYKGCHARYRAITPAIEARIEHELGVIIELGYADYFLMAWSIVRWARRQRIRVTGRGSAADSIVAYCLTLTDVDVIRRGLPFARFLAPGKIVDIDLDFPSDRRDDVFRYIIEQFGEAYVGMVCTFHTYNAKGAIRDLGKVLSIPAEMLSWASHHMSGFMHAGQLDEAFSRYAELRPHAAMKERFKLLARVCSRIAGFPRHIGTHSSGIVISRVPLAEIAPLQPSARGITQIWELDKDDAEAIGAMKLDVLSLRMLAAVGDAEQDIARSAPDFRYDRIPMNDMATYRMMRAGRAVGAFQFESAAQLALGTHLQPEHFEDLVAAVALIRPGPIQGHVVNRFVGCRNGWMRADILHDLLRPILAKTFGCVVFQEQVLQVISVLTGCTEVEADKVRKSITQHTRQGTMEQLKEWFITKSCSYLKDFGQDRAALLWEQIKGWAGYGFTEGHAASFALTGYRTAYLSHHFPAQFFSGEMNHQPMGFYAANTLAAESRRRGVTILPIDINMSRDKCAADGDKAIRLGFRLISGFREMDIQAIESAQSDGVFYSLLDFCTRVVLPRDAVENLLLCGAFELLHENRRGLLARLDETLSLSSSYRAALNEIGQTAFDLGSVRHALTPLAWDLPDFSPWDKFLWTWRLVGVTAEAHVFAWLRETLALQGIISTHEARMSRHGTRVTVAGLNIRPHRPHTVSGNPVLFTQIEDELDMIQAVALGEVIWETTSTFLTSAAVVVRGTIERKGSGVMLRIEKAKPLIMQRYAETATTQPIVVRTTRTYPGTKLTVPVG